MTMKPDHQKNYLLMDIVHTTMAESFFSCSHFVAGKPTGVSFRFRHISLDGTVENMNTKGE